MPREQSVCQYTILEDDHFEVQDLSNDDRFSDKPYVNSPLNLRYYFGIPLTTPDGYNIGALCVMDSKIKKLTPEKIELLKIIAGEIIVRLNTVKLVNDLKIKLIDAENNQKKVAHDIRGPISGIIGLSEIIKGQGEKNEIKDVLELVTMISKSGRSVLELADEILNHKQILSTNFNEDIFNLLIFKEKLQKLYSLQARNKNIKFEIDVDPEDENINISREKLLQIVGNVISNAIKFTPVSGSIAVNLALQLNENAKILTIKVTDTGIGLSNETIAKILGNSAHTSHGTSGEKGYGLGLPMVNNLVKSLNGLMSIKSEINKGTTFEIVLSIK
jgi:signal transduction histidine kinase